MNIRPKEFVELLDDKIIGQNDAKKILAIALRNRWRRTQLDGEIRKSIVPKNILMIGPTGVGKTAIIKHMADIIDAPFIKVEATRYTQIGYVGESVNSMIEELVSVAQHTIKTKEDNYYASINDLNINLKQPEITDFIRDFNIILKPIYKTKIKKLKNIFTALELDILKRGYQNLDNRIFQLNDPNKLAYVFLSVGLIPDKLKDKKGRKCNKRINKYRELFKRLVSSYANTFDCFGAKNITKVQSIDIKEHVETKGIIFIDEIDKIASTGSSGNDNVGKIGVQRDLLALLDGTTINVGMRTINTENILFIVAGAFHVSEVTDLIPELLGRLPIKVNLEPITEEIMVRILKETVNSPIRQYEQLLKVDGLDVEVTDDAIVHMAKIAHEYNINVHSMGARTLHYIVEKVFSKVSFEAFKENADSENTKLIIDKQYILDNI